MKRKSMKQGLAFLLSAALLLTQTPVIAAAENRTPEDGTIASFAALRSGVANQTVTVGTEEAELDLPDELTVTIYHVTEDVVISDDEITEEETDDISSASPSDAEDSTSGSDVEGEEKTVTTVTTSKERIPVTWDSDPAYDGDTPDKYVFTADVDGYALADGVEPPQITVTVTEEAVETPAETQPEEPAPCTKTEGCTLADGHEGECVTAPQADNSLVKNILSWTFVDDDYLNLGELPLPGVNADNPIDFDTVVSMLPTGISAEIEGIPGETPLDLTWSCPEYKQGGGSWPVTREYLFTAALPEGYACDPLPTVKVTLGGADFEAEYGGLTITGGTVIQETDGQLKLTENNGNYTISGTWGGTLDGVSAGNRKAVITMPSGVTASITLSGVTIDVNSVKYASAFLVDTGGTANFNLLGTNTLVSGMMCAGLQVPENAAVTLDGSGKLIATGGDSGAGIGGGIDGSGGTITISGGTVVASCNGNFGTGIGGGYGGNGGTVTINGGTVTATGRKDCAGIGGGFGGDGGSITISGGTVEATGVNGAGIGGGKDGDGGSIMISGGTVTATGRESSLLQGGAGIGGGFGGGGGSITIRGGTVEATGISGAGIGSGANIGSGSGKSGGTIKISGQDTTVIASSMYGYGNDVGNGLGGKNDGSLSVTDGATLEMKINGTDLTDPEYRNCIIIDKDGNKQRYNSEGASVDSFSPALSLTASPTDAVIFPGKITLTATLSDAFPGNSEKNIAFTVNGATHSTTTNASGVASYTITSLSPGTYTFGASFAGDAENQSAAAEITNYKVKFGAQAALTLNGLGSVYTYGDAAFKLSTSGGSGNGAVSYASSDPSVASVTGNTVTLLNTGTFTITATKAADGYYTAANVTSGEVTVNMATPDVSLTATGGGDTSTPIVLTATVSKVGTGATPTGTVTFKEGSNTLTENVALNGSGVTAYTVNNPAAGSHTYKAEYSGQAGYYNSVSATCTVGVGLTDQTGFTMTDPGTKTYGDSDFTLETTGGQSSGGVSFSVPAGNGVLTVAADGKAKVTGAGTVTITATKAGDDIYNQATATLSITINPRDISKVTVNVTGSRVYTGSQLQPVFEVADGTLAINTGDYTNSYGSNTDAGTGAGSITLDGQRNYTGTKTVQFDIEKHPLTGAAITLDAISYTHTGSEIEPTIKSVTVDGISVPASEYDVSYADNISAGPATVTIMAKADGNFTGTASANFTITESSGGNTGGGGSSSSSHSSYTPPATKGSYTMTGDRISQSVSRSDLQWLVNSGKSLTLSCDKAGMTFDPAALKAILAVVPATAGNLTFAATPADLSAFPDAARLIGSRPIYDFTITYKDGTGITVTAKVDFPAGSAAVTLTYPRTEAETEGSLFVVYVDDKGAVTWLDKSGYDSGKVLADAPHFSTYGVVYKAPAPVFTDTTNHWAKNEIEFVAARGLLTGTGNNLFSPDVAMTRGMFVTALGRLEGVNPASYTTRSFTDVKADAYYAAYVEWAAKKNIAGGTGEGLFSPDAPVTREQMAVILTNYAGQMDYSIPAPLAEAAFTDSDKISAWAAKEVMLMQRAGIVKGKDGNRFDPQGNATRAEISVVLRRFVEIVIDPATASGWVKNDSGHWLYYKNGKALTGWQTIGTLRYYFNGDGVMHEGWLQNTDTSKWYYWTSAGAATGWREIDGKWYYFGEDGSMAVNTTIDGYEIGPDGARK